MSINQLNRKLARNKEKITKNWFLKKINKIDKFLAILIKKR